MPKGGKKNSLKAALSSQQSRLKKKQEAAHAVQQAERARSGTKTKGKGRRNEDDDGSASQMEVRKAEALMNGMVVEPSFAKGNWAIRWRE